MPDAKLWFIDNNSPDGTGTRLGFPAKNDSCIQVFNSSGKPGIRSAHSHAILYAYKQRIETFITMDADPAQSPVRIGEMINLLGKSNAAVVLALGIVAKG